MGAAADCELIRSGFFGQPVNSITTVAFVVAGVYLLPRIRLRWIAIGLIATGFGSFLFHGPMPAGAEWAHDVPLAWLILLVGGWGRTWERWTHLPGLAALSLIFALFPQWADPLAVLLTIAALALIIHDDRTPRTIAPLSLLAVAAIVGRLGATSGPWCDPESIFQLHGVWHVAAAVAVTWWALGAEQAQ